MHPYCKFGEIPASILENAVLSNSCDAHTDGQSKNIMLQPANSHNNQIWKFTHILMTGLNTLTVSVYILIQLYVYTH